MSLLKKAAAVIVAAVLSLCLCVPVFAIDYGTDTRATADWLRAKVPTPSVGDEKVVLALLRGTYITPQQDYTTLYIDALMQHLNQGNAATQPVEDSYWQAMVLAACGMDLTTVAPSLLDVFKQPDTLDINGKRMALQLFSARTDLAESVGFDLGSSTAAIAAARNEDGGYGTGESNAVDTARFLQALASKKSSNGVAEEALLDPLAWLYMRPNDEGGFDMGGNPSATATAEVMVVLSCYGENPDLLSTDAASLSSALLYFSKGDGSFAETEDGEADVETTAICLLGLASKVRFDRDLSKIYDFNDVPAYSTPTSSSSPADASSNLTNSGSNTVAKPSGSSLLLPALVAVGIVIIAVIVFIVLRRPAKGQSPKRKPPRGY
ncbi:MAG: hypothetical protein ACK5JF_08055 [Oscillospiraceae bacterium]